MKEASGSISRVCYASLFTTLLFFSLVGLHLLSCPPALSSMRHQQWGYNNARIIGARMVI
jgi:hypothetical protein